MAYYTYSWDSTSVTISVKGLTKGDTITYYCRLSDEVNAESINKTASKSTSSAKFKNLRPDTDYTINVRVSGEFLGAETFTTDPEESLTGFYIYYNNDWHKCTPYVYYGGGWKKVTPSVYDGGWQ